MPSHVNSGPASGLPPILTTFFLLGLALLGGGLGAAQAGNPGSPPDNRESPSTQEKGATPNASVPALVEELLALRQERLGLERELEEERQRLMDEIARLRDDLEIATVRAEAEAREVQRNRARVAQARRLALHIDDWIETLATDALHSCQRLAQATQRGITFLRPERSARLDAIAAELRPRASEESPMAASEERVRGMVELLDLMQEELRLGETIEERSDRVTLADGRRVHAYVVRLGLLCEAFVSEDKGLVGLCDGDGTWRTDLDPHQRNAVLDLVATARGRRAAHLVPLPLVGGQR